MPAGVADVDMAEFYERMLTQLAPEDYEAQQQERHIERYQWFAAAALVLLLIDTLLTDRKREAAAVRRAAA